MKATCTHDFHAAVVYFLLYVFWDIFKLKVFSRSTIKYCKYLYVTIYMYMHNACDGLYLHINITDNSN
jgi:hypothetical protein